MPIPGIPGIGGNAASGAGAEAGRLGVGNEPGRGGRRRAAAVSWDGGSGLYGDGFCTFPPSSFTRSRAGTWTTRDTGLTQHSTGHRPT